jgi:hypothetical protein
MPDEPVRLRPIEEADLDTLRRFDTDPSSRGPYLTAGPTSPSKLATYRLTTAWLVCQSARSTAYHTTRAPLWVNCS